MFRKLVFLLLFIFFTLNTLNFVYAKINDGHQSTADKTMRNSRFNIGIIGGGIGGTSTAYFLQKLLGKSATLVLYEPNKIGGRLATFEISGEEYETGGSIIHPQNEYMVNFLQELGLEKRESYDSKFGIFDGQQFAFHESEWEIVTTAKLIWRYGYDVFRLRNYISAMLKSFGKIYDLQKSGKAYQTVSELLGCMDDSFPHMTQVSLESHLSGQGFSPLIVKELVAAATRANYGQMPTVHAFVGSVSVAGAGAGLWSVSGGNKRVPEELFKRSGGRMIEEFVSKVSLLPDGRFKVFATPSNVSSGVTSSEATTHDAVVIATPQSGDHRPPIRFEGFPSTVEFDFPGSYQTIVCTMVRGTLNPGTFHMGDIGVKIEEILTDNASLPFNSVGRQYPVMSSQVPETARQCPDTTRQDPDTTNQGPDTTSQDPIRSHCTDTTNQDPDTTSQGTDTTNHAPDTTNQVPDTTNQIPDTTNQDPDTTNQDPDTTNQVPDTTNQIPDTTNQDPDTSHQVPGTSRDCTDKTSHQGLKIYKVFSEIPLTQIELNKIFISYDKIKEVKWLAYPQYASGERMGRFTLFPGLFYNNAIERAASAMEMSVIAAKNSALLVSKYFKGDQSFKVENAKDEL